MTNFLAENQIYDIYVIQKSGIPLFAGCTATNYCKTHLGQHELISGFFSALYSFSNETFQDDKLKTVLYQDIILNFDIDEQNDLIFVFIHDSNSDIDLIREYLQNAKEIFLNNYRKHLGKMSVDLQLFDNFSDLLRDAGIIKDQLVDTSGMMEPEEKHQKNKPGLFNWLKGLFT